MANGAGPRSAGQPQADAPGRRVAAVKRLRGDLPLQNSPPDPALYRAKIRAVEAISGRDLRRMARKANSLQRVVAVEAAAKRLGALDAIPSSASTARHNGKLANTGARTISADILPPKCLDAVEAWRTASMARLPRPHARGLETGDAKHATSEKHLAEIDWERCGDKPAHGVSHNFLRANGKRNVALDNVLLREIGALRPALKAIYAPDHYFGWHDNRNSHGWQLLFCWSDAAAKGYWRHVEPETGKIVTISDTPGWSLKLAYYGRDEGERLKHCAAANGSWRCTLAYVVESKGMWEDIVDEFFASKPTA